MGAVLSTKAGVEIKQPPLAPKWLSYMGAQALVSPPGWKWDPPWDIPCSPWLCSAARLY